MTEKYSIKTVDGNRYDFACEQGEKPYSMYGEWIVVKRPVERITRRFLIQNIVCITKKEEVEEC